jgi:translation initiation factor IF-3
LGILPIDEAIKVAEEKGLDLIEVSSNSDVVVCKIADFGKFRYEQIKKEKESKRKQKKQELKEVKFKNKIDKSGMNIKIQTIKRILDEGDKVKIVLQLVGKAKANPEKYKPLIEELLGTLGDVKIEKDITLDGNNIIAIVSKK